LKNSFTNTHNRFYVVIKTQVGEIENPWGWLMMMTTMMMTTTMMMRKNDELCVTGLNCSFLNGLSVFFFCARKSLHPLYRTVLLFFY
jgi:hypothetical protein